MKFIKPYSLFENIISKNYHGIVRKTAGRGFSTKVVARILTRKMESMGITVVENQANTGTIYLECDSDDSDLYYWFTVRIANHTKRNEPIEFVDTINYSYVNKSQLDEVNIMNNEMEEEFIEFLDNNPL